MLALFLFLCLVFSPILIVLFYVVVLVAWCIDPRTPRPRRDTRRR